jgi:Transglutaminase-like superfamily
MICRDFSAPDHHATLFPRQGVSSLQTLAHQLASPFPSPTDKARTIFTWLHHNISYDVNSFFAGNIRASTPNSTLQSGLAVCEGYAALFTTLATHAGLESVVISGHGKGYGYSVIQSGAPLPSYSPGHAWNAVAIDNGEWKLIDACWGAGHVQGAGMPYVQRFEPRYFTMSNEEFGIKHFPGNKDMFFLPHGHRLEWEDYILIDPACWPSTVEPPTVFSNARPDYGVGERTVMPRSKVLHPKKGGNIRFSFRLECPHWTLDRHTKKGPPPVFILAIHGIDGREKDYIPLEHVPGSNPAGGGDMWFVDVEARSLGAAGQSLTLAVVSSFGDRKDAKGLTVVEFREGKGRVGMEFNGVAAWELV